MISSFRHHKDQFFWIFFFFFYRYCLCHIHSANFPNALIPWSCSSHLLSVFFSPLRSLKRSPNFEPAELIWLLLYIYSSSVTWSLHIPQPPKLRLLLHFSFKDSKKMVNLISKLEFFLLPIIVWAKLLLISWLFSGERRCRGGESRLDGQASSKGNPWRVQIIIVGIGYVFFFFVCCLHFDLNETKICTCVHSFS